MRESIANSYIFTLVIIFVGIMIVILIGSISYSKTFKIKNRIVDMIELNQGWDDELASDVEVILTDAGYKINHGNSSRAQCPATYNNGTLINTITNHRYCVYQINTNGKGHYYHVTVFMSFDIPIIGDLMVFSLGGDTKIVYDL